MDTIPVWELPDTAPPPPSPARAPRRPRFRWVLPVALLLVAGQLGLRTWAFAQREFYGDDLHLQMLADRSPLFSWSYLLDDYDGHLMPGAFLVAGLVERAGPLEWWPAAVSLVVMQALASLALLRVLWVLLGNRPVLLVPLAFGLFTPMALGAMTWWAAALNSMPLQIGLAWYVAAAVRFAQTGRRRYAVSGTAAVAFALAFYLKAVLIPPVAFVIVVVVLLRDGVRNPLWAAVRRGWLLWAGTVVVVGVWAVTYLSTREEDPASAGSTEDVLTTIRTGLRAVVPAVLSGPWDWVMFGVSTPLSDPPHWTTAVGCVVLAVAFVWTCVWTCVRLRGALAVWLLTVGFVGTGLLMAAIGRSSLGLSTIAPLAYRYFAADAVLLPIAGALLLTLPVRRVFRREALDRRARARRWPTVAAAGLTTVLTAAFVAGATRSTVDHVDAWEGSLTGEYLDTARSSLAAAGPAPLLDQLLPPVFTAYMSPPADSLSGLLAALPDRPEIAGATTELQLLDDTGRLVPARLQPVVRVLPGSVPQCGTPVLAGSAAAVPLEGSVPDWIWTVQLDYVASRDGVITVGSDGGEPVDAPVTTGAGTVFVRLLGPASALQVSSPTEGLDVCVAGGVLGEVVLP